MYIHVHLYKCGNAIFYYQNIQNYELKLFHVFFVQQVSVRTWTVIWMKKTKRSTGDAAGGLWITLG